MVGKVLAVSVAFALTIAGLSNVYAENEYMLNKPEVSNTSSLNVFNGKIVSLCLHRVGYTTDDLTITPDTFRSMIHEAKNAGYTFIDAKDLKAIKDGKMKQPKKAIFLGFDDGYKDNFDYAYPILKEENVKGTFFIIGNLISHEDRMTFDDIRELIAGGMSIGSHTMNHDALNDLSHEQITSELNDSKYLLEKTFNTEINSIAYPGGFENEYVIKEASRIYDVGFIASMDKKISDTPLTIHRTGIFRWTTSISPLLHNQSYNLHNDFFIKNIRE